MDQKEKYIEMMKRLISALEGAPFPTTLTKELYQIWYEHSRETTGEALELIARTEKRKS